MKITIFRHMFANGPGSLGDVLTGMNLPYEVIDSWDYDFSGFDAREPDLLIVMGGSTGVYQKDDYPFLRDEIEILEKRLSDDLPTLGICLGAQMMAQALGSRVYTGGQGPEIGWLPLTLTGEGKKSPVRHLDGSLTSMLHWHGDTFELPEGAVLLASSALYENQAFSYGMRGMALQSHPEITPHILKEWLVRHAPAAQDGRIDLARLRKDTEKHAAALVAQTGKFFREWLAQSGLIQARPGSATI